MTQSKQSSKSIIGYFHSLEIPWNASEEQESIYELKRAEFAKYLDALQQKTESLDYRNYGSDIELILLQFHLFTTYKAANHYKDLENYRSKEKAIGANILIDNDNFFDKSEDERHKFWPNQYYSGSTSCDNDLSAQA